MHYVLLFSVYIIYVTAIAFMCFANKHIIIIIIIKLYKYLMMKNLFSEGRKNILLCCSSCMYIDKYMLSMICFGRMDLPEQNNIKGKV